jgi:thiol-disulfide isomerase/thioredoxin
MNKFAFSLLCAAFVFCISCNKLSNRGGSIVATDSLAHLTVSFRNANGNPPKIFLKIPNINNEKIRLINPVEQDGCYRFDFRLASQQNISLMPDFLFLLMQPGDSLHIDLDANDFFNFSLSGNAAADRNRELCNYFSETSFRPGRNFYVATDMIKYGTMEDIIAELNNQKSAHDEIKKRFLSEFEFRKELDDLTEAMSDLDYCSTLIYASLSRELFHKQGLDLDTLLATVESKSLKWFETGVLTESHFEFATYYRGLLEEIAKRRGVLGQGLQAVDSLSGSPAVSDMIRAIAASDKLQSKDLPAFEEIAARVGDKTMRDRLNLEYRRTVEYLENPKPWSDGIKGVLGDSDNPMTGDGNLIGQTIAKNRGKVQIIQFWASFCQSSFAEWKDYAAIAEKYRDRGFEITFVCYAGDEERVDKIRKQYGIENFPNYTLTTSERIAVENNYALNVFPNALLIDKNGNIVDFGSHIYPDSVLENRIDRLLDDRNMVEIPKK